jgi:hypothetical protein
VRRNAPIKVVRYASLTHPTKLLGLATILYHLHNQETVSAYLADWLAWSHKIRKQQQENSPPFIEKLRALKAQKQAGFMGSIPFWKHHTQK